MNPGTGATFGIFLSPITSVASTWYNETNNRLPTSLFGYATNGNVNAIGASSFNYDAENRQTAAGNTNGTASYTYDGDGNRVTKTAKANAWIEENAPWLPKVESVVEEGVEEFELNAGPIPPP